MNTDVSTILLIVAGVAIVVLFLARLWKALLAVAGLGLLGLMLWAFGGQASATREVAAVASTAQSQAGASTLLSTLLGILLVAAVVGLGFFWLRWRIAERQRDRAIDGWRPGGQGWRSGPNAQWESQGRYPDPAMQQMSFLPFVLMMMQQMMAQMQPRSPSPYDGYYRSHYGRRRAGPPIMVADLDEYGLNEYEDLDELDWWGEQW